ncbi:MAG: ABC transporter substrate-binding protein, partial [Emcibacteraceae bacterium]|nr:ABC transporter substrate-binding protein [Emcibacteraceae bacterium]
MLLQKLHTLTGIFTLSLLLISCGPDGENAPLSQSAPPAPEREIANDSQSTNPSAPRNIISSGFSRDDQISTPIDNRPARLKINVGVMLPLSGETGEMGQALLNAITLALFDAADKRIEIIPVDTHGTPEGAAEAANSLVANNADIIIGPLFSGSIKV